jgi:hypothetical protein
LGPRGDESEFRRRAEIRETRKTQRLGDLAGVFRKK